MINKNDLETALSVVSKMQRTAIECDKSTLDSAKQLIIDKIDEVYNKRIEHKAPVRENTRYSFTVSVDDEGVSSPARKVK